MTHAAVLRRSTDGVSAAQVADRLCATAVVLLGLDAGALCVLQAPQVSVPVGISGDLALVAEQVQFTAGEGPCWTAYGSGTPVLVDDLSAPGSPARVRWPVYVAELVRVTPWRGLLALPVRVRLGVPVVLVAYSEAPLAALGPPLQEWPAVVTALAEVLEAVTAAAAERPLWLDSSSAWRRGRVWMAEGLLVRSTPGLEPSPALAAMRTYCAVEGGTVDEVAEQLLSGTLTAGQVLGLPPGPG